MEEEKEAEIISMCLFVMVFVGVARVSVETERAIRQEQWNSHYIELCCGARDILVIPHGDIATENNFQLGKRNV